MKVGFLQFAPEHGNPQKTTARLDELLNSVQDADLLVLPELCNSGYLFESREEALATAESVKDSPFLAFLHEHARRLKCIIVSGFNEREGEELYNSAALVTAEGVQGIYRKLHLFLDEKDIFEPGDYGLPVFEVNGVKIGILICFDWQFPEAWRVLALNGADIVCHPSNLVLKGLAQRAVPLHAMLNRYYVVTANRIGTEEDLTFTGRSIVSDPLGNVLSESTDAEEEIVILDIDITKSRDKRVTARNDLLADRRPEHYGDLLRK